MKCVELNKHEIKVINGGSFAIPYCVAGAVVAATTALIALSICVKAVSGNRKKEIFELHKNTKVFSGLISNLIEDNSNLKNFNSNLKIKRGII